VIVIVHVEGNATVMFEPHFAALYTASYPVDVLPVVVVLVVVVAAALPHPESKLKAGKTAAATHAAIRRWVRACMAHNSYLVAMKELLAGPGTCR
jgi:hypothetical protein